MARGRFKYSRSLLRKLLTRHEHQRYVFVRKAELLEYFRRCAFFLKFPAPTVNEALTGRLVKFDAATGKITIEYTPQTLRDFDEPWALDESARKLTWQPAIWRGAYTIELSGKSYRQTVHGIDRVHEIRVGCTVHVCRTEAATSNSRSAISAIPMAHSRRASSTGPRTQEPNCEANPHPRASVRPSRCASTSERRSSAPSSRARHSSRSNARRARRTRSASKARRSTSSRSRAPSTRVGFTTRLDHRRQLQLDEFDRTYAGEEVPDWLAAVSIPNEHSFNPAQAWPADATEQYHPILRDIVSFFERGEYEAGPAYMEDVNPDVIPTNTRSYLRARFYSELDEIDEAMKACACLVSGDPEFITGRQLRAELRVRQGQGEDAAIADYRAMTREHPKARELYVDLAVVMIHTGRAKDAAGVLAAAVRETGNGKELMTLQRMLLSVTRGPRWARTFAYQSTNYDVRSNISEDICKTAAAILEDAHKIFARALGKPRRTSRDAYRVFLFAGRTGYEHVCNDILGERDTHTAELYSAVLKQLLIWILPDQAAMLRTIRHEGFHQYFDSVVQDAPAWLNDGFADYFETDGSARVRADQLRVLRAATRVPTGKFVAMPAKVFYRGSDLHYTRAWALVYFVREGPAKWREILPALLASLAGGRSTRSAVRVAFRRVDLVALDAEFGRWVLAGK